ncbi:hypothetical protein V4762_04520 [Thermodesulfobium sp. 4217-1]|uniref:hypothetical protein n=1 Tax=Thermodesulfobium sp. 4217-1 TaxID=3120013 RepID=UPI003221E128
MKNSFRNGEKFKWSTVVGIPKCVTFPETKEPNYRIKNGYKIEFAMTLEGLGIHNALLVEKETSWNGIM